MRMKAGNQIAIISSIVVMLATTAVIAGSYNVQTAKAAYGNEVIKPNAQQSRGAWGDAVSGAAHESNGDNGQGHGLGDVRANGCKSGQTTGNPCS